jgi:hypothetical protein
MDRPDLSLTVPGSGAHTRKSNAGTPPPRAVLSMPNTSQAVANSKIEKLGTTMTATDLSMSPLWQKL